MSKGSIQKQIQEYHAYKIKKAKAGELASDDSLSFEIDKDKNKKQLLDFSEESCDVDKSEDGPLKYGGDNDWLSILKQF